MILKKVFDLENEHNLILDDSYIENIKEGNKKYKLLRGEIIQANGRCVKCNSTNISKNGIYKKTVRLTKLNDSQVKNILVIAKMVEEILLQKYPLLKKRNVYRSKFINKFLSIW